MNGVMNKMKTKNCLFLIALLLIGIPLLFLLIGCTGRSDIFEELQAAKFIPDIIVKEGATEIPDGTGSYYFGHVMLGNSSSPVTFIIENPGTSDLTINSVSLTAGDIFDFSIDDSSMLSTVSSGGSTTFTITFSPINSGLRSAVVSIDSDDPDEELYTFVVEGDGDLMPEADINVKQGSNDLPDEMGDYYFGHVLKDNFSPPVIFTIENKGTGDLSIISVSLTAGDTDDFSIDDSSMLSTVSSGGSTTFTITFSPINSGLRSAIVTIYSNDPDEKKYTFIVRVVGDLIPEPDIVLKKGSTEIHYSTGSYYFGHVIVSNSSAPVTFTIENKGTANLNINSVSLTAGDTGDFIIDDSMLLSPLSSMSSTTFAITFSPTAVGGRSAIVTIDSDDPDENLYDFIVEVDGDLIPEPDIIVKERSSYLPDGTGIYYFGHVMLGNSSAPVTFTIKNKGTANLNINSVSLTAGDTGDFIIDDSLLLSPVSPGGSTIFTITFSPTAVGSRAAIVAIDNDDSDKNPYTFTLTGGGDAIPLPYINVKEGSNNIPNGTGSYYYGHVVVGNSSTAVTFTIKNKGTDNLNINSVSLTAGDTGDFIIDDSLLLSPVSPGGSTIFTITFSPTAVGSRSAIVTIYNNDSDENPYTFMVEGDGDPAPIPDINLKREGTQIPNGTGSYDFRHIVVGNSSLPVTFTIENAGSDDLNINSVLLTAGDTGDFSINDALMVSPVSPGGSTTFTVTFSPISVGSRSATVTIDNDDPDENPYTFAVKGTGDSIAEPEINIKEGGNNIPNGIGSYYFGHVTVGNSSPPVTFTIENAGSDDLNINSVSLTSGDTGYFSIDDALMVSPVSPGSSTTFTVTFSPINSGFRSATVTIDNDDPDENPYTFMAEGYGDLIIEPDINVRQESTDLPDGIGSYDFGSVQVGNSSAPVTFKIENKGTADLTLNSVLLTAGDTGDFSIDDALMSSPVSPGSITTFAITFSPTISGFRSATVTIDNDDPDEAPYTFTVDGNGSVIPIPDINLKQDGTQLPNGTGIYTFGSVLEGTSSAPVTFTIENNGTGNLTVNSVSLTAGDIFYFSIDDALMSSPVSPGNSTTFTITFSPIISGERSATVTVDNDDPDEATYTFTVEGYGIPSASPDINVKQGGTQLPDGTGIYDFGSWDIGSSRTRDFKIENKGSLTLNIYGISFVSGDMSQFDIDLSTMSSVISAGGNTTFLITFSPTSVGIKSAVVSIDSDDPDEDPYTFTVEGTGNAAPVPGINIKEGLTDYPDGSIYDFGVVFSSVIKTFTIENNGTADLEIYNILLTDGDQDDFELDTSSTSFTVPPISTTDFDVIFDPQSSGSKWRNLEINHNAPGSPYDIRLEGYKF